MEKNADTSGNGVEPVTVPRLSIADGIIDGLIADCARLAHSAKGGAAGSSLAVAGDLADYGVALRAALARLDALQQALDGNLDVGSRQETRRDDVLVRELSACYQRMLEMQRESERAVGRYRQVLDSELGSRAVAQTRDRELIQRLRAQISTLERVRVIWTERVDNDAFAEGMAAYRERNTQLKAALSGMSTSAAFQVGHMLTGAVKSPKAALALPMRVIRLAREMLRRRKSVGAEGFPLPAKSVIELALPHEWQMALADQDVGAMRDQGAQSRRLVNLSEVMLLDRLPVAKAPPSVASARIALVADSFTCHALANTCVIGRISRDDWKQEIAQFGPDVLLVESAWEGHDGSWRGVIEACGVELREMLLWCKRQGIPTVFWAKEDPVHFDRFIASAKLFEHVCTTDLDRVGDYCEMLGHNRVYLLPFWADPVTRNPLEYAERRAACSFAGSFYRQYPKRSEFFTELVKELHEVLPVEIYDRNAGAQDELFAYPDELKANIVGSLPFELIDRAYKGYRFGISMNTVRDSQSMLARRVYELMASNTLVVGNYARASRLLFGELAIMTDDARIASERVAALMADPAQLDRVRLHALRKVMSEHLGVHRMAYLFGKVFGREYEEDLTEILVVAQVGSEAELQAVLRNYRAQSYRNRRLRLVCRDGFWPRGTLEDDDVEWYTEREAAGISVSQRSQLHYVAGFSAEDTYGAHYLEDLCLAHSYAPGRVIGKATYLSSDSDVVRLENVGMEYRGVAELALRRALVPATKFIDRSLLDLSMGIDHGSISCADAISLDRFNYCQGSGGAAVAEASDAIEFDTGLPFGEVLGAAEHVTRPAMLRSRARSVVWKGGALAAEFPAARHSHGQVRVRHASNGVVVIRSSLPPDKYAYVYAGSPVAVASLAILDRLPVILDAVRDANVALAAIFLDKEGRTVGSTFTRAKPVSMLRLPDGCASVRIGFRVAGPGRFEVRSVRMANQTRHPDGRKILPLAERLLIAKGYPSHDALYRYAFVHKRVLAYRRTGLRHDVLRWDPEGMSFDEFQGVEVTSGAEAELRAMMHAKRYKSIEVHPLYPEMWRELKHHLSSTQVNIWVHGTEIQPWYRRPWSYPPGPARLTAARASAERGAMWRSIFAMRHPNLNLIFVSDYLARQAMNDVGIELQPWQYRVIHNFIDEGLFVDLGKPAEQRHRILSIRPYSSPIYGNDLAVKAVLELSQEEWFDQLEFRFVGDGPLFDETLAPLRRFKNVTIEQGFLTQTRIAELHREHGVFLVPSRMDTQGVSRDEAMCSGLVPVCSRVGAVPEFVDESCGILAEAEDHLGLAEGIRALHASPALFSRLSTAAARRVRMQSGFDSTIEREIRLIRGQELEDRSTSQVRPAPSALRRLAVYGDLNLNITDGSAVWAVSFVQVLAGLSNVEVHLYLKASVQSLHIIQPLLEMENVKLVQPVLDGDAQLLPSQALDAIASDDRLLNFDAVVLRGLELCDLAAQRSEFARRLWVYITDLPHRENQVDAQMRAKLSHIFDVARFKLCQTSDFEQYLHRVFPQSVGKTRLLPPMIPQATTAADDAVDPSAVNFVYAGKFAPLWGIREMLDVFGSVRATHRRAEFHVYGDKIHHVPEDPGFRGEITDRLSGTDGVYWHRQVTREELYDQLPRMTLGWAWRPAALEEETLELSTKVLEYAACGLPVVMYPNRVNVEVFGADYPLFARESGEALEVITRFLASREMRAGVAETLRRVASNYTFGAIRARFVAPLLPEGAA